VNILAEAKLIFENGITE